MLSDIFLKGDKSSKEDAIKELRKKAVEVWEGPFYVRFKEGVLELLIEFDCNKNSGIWKGFDGPRFMGYELHILKVPFGYTKDLSE